jgi:hypothetical protein
MSYIGNPLSTSAFLTDSFSGTGSQTAFTLSAAPANTASILVAISGVLQDPTTYSLVGTTLNFSAAPPSATGNISVRYLGIPAAGVVNTAYRTVTEYTATSNQTTFTPPSYTVGFINVFRNGIMLGSADYTANNGTTVVLASGATAGDLIAVESFYVASFVNAIQATPGAVNAGYLANGAALSNLGSAQLASANMPAGSVLQVVSTTKTNTFSTGATSFTDVTGLSVSITPTKATSKILIFCTIPCSHASFAIARFNLVRGSTNICQPLSASGLGSSKTAYYQNNDLGAAADLHFLDSPATTSSTTYKIQCCTNGGTMFVGQRASGDMDMPSTITVMEIAQ